MKAPKTVKTYNDLDTHMKRISRAMAEKEQELILTQLNDLISTGVIEVVKGPLTLVTSYDEGERVVEIKQAVSLTFHGAERMKELEAENERLRKKNNELSEHIRRHLNSIEQE